MSKKRRISSSEDVGTDKLTKVQLANSNKFIAVLACSVIGSSGFLDGGGGMLLKGL